MDRKLRRETLDVLHDLNEAQYKEFGHPETATRISQYELAYRMQMSVPEVMDISKESKETLEAYGAVPGQASFANNCLLARRLTEKGVRFVQLFDWGWDFHGTREAEGINDGLTKKCAAHGQASHGALRDLKQRGLLDETLVVWGGEFGRTPFREGRTAASAILGRDHYPDCFTMFLAGGGVKPGFVYGETDELGFSVTRDKVHVHDLQATILHLLGFDHAKLTFRFQGRDFRLTDVHGEVVKEHPGLDWYFTKRRFQNFASRVSRQSRQQDHFFRHFIIRQPLTHELLQTFYHQEWSPPWRPQTRSPAHLSARPACQSQPLLSHPEIGKVFLRFRADKR